MYSTTDDSMDKPLVSICCCAFNHEPYIQRCLDGFVEQRTLFPFEILIHDDASTDKTASIIAAYAQRFPALFKPIYQTENQYSKGNDPCTKILFPMARGKYIAICEGDDYWTDPLKLQKQVDYLEAHPDCSLVFGNSIEHWDDGSRPDRTFCAVETRVYSDLEVCWNWNQLMQTACIMFRKHIFTTPLYKEVCNNPTIVVGDLPLFLTCAHFGHLYGFSDIFAVYRRHHGSYTMTVNSEKRLKLGNMWGIIPAVFGSRYSEVSFYYAIYNYRAGMRAAINEDNQPRRRLLFRKIIILYLTHPLSAAKRLSRIFKERSANSFAKTR